MVNKDQSLPNLVARGITWTYCFRTIPIGIEQPQPLGLPLVYKLSLKLRRQSLPNLVYRGITWTYCFRTIPIGIEQPQPLGLPLVYKLSLKIRLCSYTNSWGDSDVFTSEQSNLESERIVAASECCKRAAIRSPAAPALNLTFDPRLKTRSTNYSGKQNLVTILH